MNKLTDLEICKKIAEIEGEYENAITRRDNYNKYLVHVQDKAEFTRWFNPLTDDALCFRLMVKYELEVFKVGAEWMCAWTDSNLTSRDKSPNRAICLAIIAANEDKL